MPLYKTLQDMASALQFIRALVKFQLSQIESLWTKRINTIPPIFRMNRCEVLFSSPGFKLVLERTLSHTKHCGLSLPPRPVRENETKRSIFFTVLSLLWYCFVKWVNLQLDCPSYWLIFHSIKLIYATARFPLAPYSAYTCKGLAEGSVSSVDYYIIKVVWNYLDLIRPS